MYKQKVRVIAAVCIAALTAGIYASASVKSNKEFLTPDTTQLDLNSCRHTMEEPAEYTAAPNRLADLSGYEKLAENESLALYYADKNCSIRVLNKKTGYVWGSPDADSISELNDMWIEMADSVVSIDYLNNECMTNQISMSNSECGHTYTTDGNTVHFKFSADNIGISFEFDVELKENSLSVSMVDGSLRETGDNLLKSVYFMPFFGATREDDTEGYMFVPDGPGALIRYAKSSKYLFAFDKRIYGADAAVDSVNNSGNLLAKRTNDYLTDEPTVTAPVFGVSHGTQDNAYLAVVESGAEYADIYSCPSGYVVDYNRITARFNFRTVYSQAMKKDGSGINVNQETPNKTLPKISYYFLEGENADYSGMAVKYRDLLTENGELSANKSSDSDVPLRIDAIAADKSEGKLFDKYLSLTTVSQAESIVNELKAEGISSIDLVYKGWTKGGLSGGKYGNISIDKRLGSMSDLNNLNKTLKDGGGKLYLWINPFTANKSQCNTAAQSTQTMSRKIAAFYRDNPNIRYNTDYIIKPKLMLDTMSRFIKKYKGFSLVAEGIGNNIYSDFTTGETVLRNTTEKAIVKVLSGVKQDLALSNPNEYLWKEITDYFDMPLENSQYLFETDTVPFLPIVLNGFVNCFSPYINQGYCTADSYLKIIEYGLNPSFLIMSEDNGKLVGTTLEDYFSISYDSWKSQITEVYKTVNDVLKEIKNSYITDHKVLQSGVVKVAYSNGKTVIVNYNNEDFVFGDASVKAKSAGVIGGVTE